MAGIDVERVKQRIEEIVKKHGEDYKFVEQGYLCLAQCWAADKKVNTAGRHMIMDISLMDRLKAMDDILSTIKEHPKILQVPITKPIFITGYMRTGSTFMHQLLHQDPAMYAPPLWQVMAPLPLTDGKVPKDDPRYVACQQFSDHWNACPGWLQKHQAFKPTSVEECMMHLSHTGLMKEMLYGCQSNEAYLDWYEHLDEETKLNIYTYYKKELQLHAYMQDYENITYLRKDSLHLAAMQALLGVFPDARFIHLLRDPLEVMGSTFSVQYTVTAGYYDPEDIDRPAIGRRLLRHAEHVLNKYVDYREATDGKDGQASNCIDVYYDDLMSKPLDVVRKIYKFFNMELSDTALSKMQEFLKENPINKHGKHNYDISTYGLTESDIRKVFKRYSDYFNLKY